LPHRKWWVNQFRLLAQLDGLYPAESGTSMLTEAIRRLGLRGTRMTAAQVNTLRVKLLKIGALLIKRTSCCSAGPASPPR